MATVKFYGTGRRKSSVARVYLVAGSGKIVVNKRDIDDQSSKAENQVVECLQKEKIQMSKLSMK